MSPLTSLTSLPGGTSWLPNLERMPVTQGISQADASQLAQGLEGAASSDAATKAAGTTAVQPNSFSNFLENAVNEVNSKMQTADTEKAKVLSGETTNVHQAMIATQESSVAFNLMVEVRNKLVDSYQELMRMQV